MGLKQNDRFKLHIFVQDVTLQFKMMYPRVNFFAMMVIHHDVKTYQRGEKSSTNL